MIKNIFKKNRNKTNLSYSQSGEDKIVSFIFDWIQIEKPIYLDIGAHHYSWLSNTYLFYLNGATGVCVEPDPFLFKEIKRHRPRDICLNVGVGVQDGIIADYFVMTSKSLNTFSKEEALVYANTSNYGEQRIEEVLAVPIKNVNRIVLEQFAEKKINFVSIDVEGWDFEIIKSFNFELYEPEVFCIETMRRGVDGKLIKNSELISYMESKNYMVYADTFINTIFISAKVRALLN